MIDLLKNLGFTQTEAEIYLQLLKKGNLTAVELSKDLKIHRRTIYDNLNLLVNKGVVSFHSNRAVKHFCAANPEVLKKIEEDKLKELNKSLPKLSQYYKEQKKDPFVEILKGTDAAKNVMHDMLNAKEEILWMGGGFKILEVFDKKRDLLLRELNQIPIRIIQPSPNLKIFKQYFKKKNIKFIDKKYATGCVFFVFDNLVLIGTLVNDDFFIIKIENSDIAQTYKNYFEIIWKK